MWFSKKANEPEPTPQPPPQAPPPPIPKPVQERRKNRNWLGTWEGPGYTSNSQAMLQVLQDIRDEMQTLNKRVEDLERSFRETFGG